MEKMLVRRPRHFEEALRSLYSQSMFSSSTQDLELSGRGIPLSSTRSNNDVVFRGRGRPVFIPQEILDQKVRRPASSAPPPLPSQSSNDLAQFTALFSGKQVDDLEIYRIMESYIFQRAGGLQDLQKMMQRLSSLALDCHINVPTICKYLYVFSQDPKGSDLRNAFFTNLEADFMNREELRLREGPVRYRNFIKWVMGAAHHYRNLLYAPFDELMLSLIELANEISEFNDTEDIRLYVTLILRFYYYSSLPCSDGTDVSAKLGEEHTAAILRARNHVRRQIVKGGLSAEQMHWLILLMEVTRSSPTIESIQRAFPRFKKSARPQGLILVQLEQWKNCTHLEAVSIAMDIGPTGGNLNLFQFHHHTSVPLDRISSSTIEMFYLDSPFSFRNPSGSDFPVDVHERAT